MVNVLSKNLIPSLPEIIRGEGIRIYDKNENEYFDLASQTCNLNLGHAHPVIIDAIKEALERETPYFVSSRNENSLLIKLTEKLVEIAPEGLSKVNLKLCNGSDANEDAIKRARKYHADRGNKKIILAQYGSHHGESSETLSASGKHFPKEAHSYLGGSNNYLFIEPCNLSKKPKSLSEEKFVEKCVNSLEEIVEKKDDIAGLIVELVQVDAGVIPQPLEYIKKIEEICKNNNIVFIVDEVQTAFGWCGNIFASNNYNIHPDIITLGKALTSGFPAMAATIFRENLDNLDYGESEFTNGGQTYPCIAALSNINYLQTSGILDKVEEKHQHLLYYFRKMKNRFEEIRDIRSYGLISGIEFVKEDNENSYISDRVYQSALNNKLILRKTKSNGNNNVLLIKPPIIITHDEIEHTMNILNKSLVESLK